MMRNYRCFGCRRIIFRGIIVVARIEVKCACNFINVLEVGELPALDKIAKPVVAFA